MPRGRTRGRAVGRAPARRRRARTPPALDHRSDLNSGSSDEERQPLQRARPANQTAQEAPEQPAMPDPVPPILQPEPPTYDQQLDRMELMLNMQNARIEVLLEARQPDIPAAQGVNPVNPPAYQHQQTLAQGAVPVQGYQFPPIQDLGVSPLAPFLLLGAIVDKATKTKIWEGRFIDLPILSNCTLQPSLAVNWNGTNTSLSMTPPKLSQPSTYREWLDLFLIYATILIEMRPQEAPGLFTYIARIGELEAVDHSMVWLEYDMAFRRLKAIKQDLPWQKTVMEILWPIQKRRQADSRKFSMNNDQPMQSASGGSPPSQTCHCYYFRGYCRNFDDCQYNHLCGHCQQAGHPLTECLQGSDS